MLYANFVNALIIFCISSNIVLGMRKSLEDTSVCTFLWAINIIFWYSTLKVYISRLIEMWSWIIDINVLADAILYNLKWQTLTRGKCEICFSVSWFKISKNGFPSLSKNSDEISNFKHDDHDYSVSLEMLNHTMWQLSMSTFYVNYLRQV